MAINSAETMKEITRNHLKNGGVAIGQCLTAVGWVGGTVPEMSQEEGLIELSMADVAGGGFAVGLALAGRRPIYIVRYQGFQWFNAAMIVNYAAKSKEMWGIPCPVFVRSIAMEGGIGPVASNSHHGIFTRMPGIPVCAPMTPGEYKKAWDYFINHNDPLYVSEHRGSFKIDHEIRDKIHPEADITVLAISATRLNALEAIEKLEKNKKVKCNFINLFWLKPFKPTPTIIRALKTSRFGGLLLDGDYENGTIKSIAYDLMKATGKNIAVMGLEEKAAGFAPHLDNLPPSPAKIIKSIYKICR